MSNTWKDLRPSITVATLATTDPDVEALQIANAGMEFVAPPRCAPDTGELINEIALQVLAYSGEQIPANILAGTCTLQVLEKTPDGHHTTTYVYAGRDPKTSLVMGRIYIFDARYLHAFSARISTLGGAAAGADNLRVRWRPYR